MGEGGASREQLAVLQPWELSEVRKDYPAGAELSVTRGTQMDARWPPQEKLTGNSSLGLS